MCSGWDARYSTKGIGDYKCALAGTQGTVQKVYEKISVLWLGRKLQYKRYRRGKVCSGWDARYCTKGLGEDKCALAGTQGTVQKV